MLGLWLARIIRWINVSDHPWPSAMKLKHCIALCPGEMLHIRGPEAKRAGGHRTRNRLIELVSHTYVESA